jgi:hypothetical protein
MNWSWWQEAFFISVVPMLAWVLAFWIAGNVLVALMIPLLAAMRRMMMRGRR